MNTQLAQYQLDNMTVLDIMMNTLSAAEKLVFKDKEGKKYAYYDEGNSSEWKNDYQLLKELKIQKECLQSMIHVYNNNKISKNFEFPVNLSKEDIIGDLNLLKDEAMILYNNDKNIQKVYNDIITIINGQHCDRYSVEEICQKEQIVPMDEETVIKNAKSIVNAKNKIIEKEKENENALMRNGGKIDYHAKLFAKKNFRKDNYFKNMYNSMK
jgi:hypothetical protein